MKYFKDNIEKLTKSNTNFRKIAFTGKHSQLSLMSLKPNQDIGDEVHKVDQFFRVEQGEGNAVIAGEENKVSDGDAFIVPAGTKHNVFNVGKTLLKLYTIYSPPQHKDGVVHKTKLDAIKEEEDNRAENRDKDDSIPFHMYGAPTGYDSEGYGPFLFRTQAREEQLIARSKSESKKRVLIGSLGDTKRKIERLNKGKNRAEENTMDNSYNNLQSMLDEGWLSDAGSWAKTKLSNLVKTSKGNVNKGASATKASSAYDNAQKATSAYGATTPETLDKDYDLPAFLRQGGKVKDLSMEDAVNRVTSIKRLRMNQGKEQRIPSTYTEEVTNENRSNSEINLQGIINEGFKEILGNAVTKVAKAIKVPGEAPEGPSIKPIKRNMSTYVSGILSDQHKKEEKEHMSHPYSPRREDQRVDRWTREFRRDKNRVKAEAYGLKRGTKYKPVNDPDFNESCSYQNLSSMLNEVYDPEVWKKHDEKNRIELEKLRAAGKVPSFLAKPKSTAETPSTVTKPVAPPTTQSPAKAKIPRRDEISPIEWANLSDSQADEYRRHWLASGD